MSDQAGVNPKIVDSVNQARAATLGSQSVRTDAAGKTYQSVAQSAAIAVQDAAHALRNATTVATAAAGAAITQFLVSGDARFLVALSHTQNMVDEAIANYAAIGAASAQMLKDFPSDS